MAPLTLTRRSLFTVAALAGAGALAGCHPLPTKPSGWADGVPEAPKRITKETAVCDTRPLLPRPVLSLDSSLLFTHAWTAQLAGRSGAMLWDTAAGRLLPDSLLGVGSGYSSFRPDNSLLDAVGAFVVHVDHVNGTARHFGTGHRIFELSCGPVTGILSLVCSPDGRYVATGGYDGYVGIFDWQTATRVAWTKVTPEDEMSVEVRGFIQDKLVVSLHGGTLLLRMDGTQAFRFDEAVYPPLVAGDTLLLSGDNGWVRTDPETGKELSHIPSQNLREQALTPDGRTLFTSPMDTTTDSPGTRPFSFTDLEAGTGLTRTVTIDILTGGTALLPDGRLLATTSEGIAVLDSLTGTPQGMFTA